MQRFVPNSIFLISDMIVPNFRKKPEYHTWRMTGFLILMISAFFVATPARNVQADSADAFLDQCRKAGADAAAQGRLVISGSDGWLFLAQEMVHLGKKRFWGTDAQTTGIAPKPEHRDPLAVIVDFADQLKKNGIHLILMPVPPKALIYSEKLMPDFGVANTSDRLDPWHAAFYALLKEKGVDVLDLTPIFRKEKNRIQEPLYCRTDTHWSGAGCDVAARAVFERMISRGIVKQAPVTSLTAQVSPVGITGDLARLLNPADPVKETLSLRFVTRGSGPASLLVPDAKSPFLVLADSHGLVFHDGEDMHAAGGGFFDQLSYELGQAVDLIAVRGSGATPVRINLMRRVRPNPDYLKQKKVVVWCFSAREFTESDGWRVVPIFG